MGANTSIPTAEFDPFMDPDVLRKKFMSGGSSSSRGNSIQGGSSAGNNNNNNNNGQRLLSPSTSSTSLTNSFGATAASSSSSSFGGTIAVGDGSPSSNHGSATTSTTTTTSSNNVLIMGSNAPLLYEYALVGNWVELLKRIQLYPREAKYMDKCKNTSIHVACRRQPPIEVVDALIEAYPDALQNKTLDGLTPLHFCCFCGSNPNTVQRILKDMNILSSNHATTTTTTSSISLVDLVDRRGRTPLHCVCAGFRSLHRLQVIRILLEVDPSCAIAQDERHRTPLSLIIDDYAEEIQETLSSSTTEEAKYKCIDSMNGDLYECWEVTSLLLKAAYYGTIQDHHYSSNDNEVSLYNRFHILHAAVGIGCCPSVFIRLILKTLPNAISQRDGEFNLPLHISCKTCLCAPEQQRQLLASSYHNLKVHATTTTKLSPRNKSSSIVYNADFGRRRRRRRRSQRYFNSNIRNHHVIVGGQPEEEDDDDDDDDDMTSELLQAYPEAASIKDEYGKLPFILAIESGKSWKGTLMSLWDAYPIMKRNNMNHYDDDDLEESFEILREVFDGALTSVSDSLRKETIITLGHVARQCWPKTELNDWIIHIIEFCRDDCDGLDHHNMKLSSKQHERNHDNNDGEVHSSSSSSDDSTVGSALQASKLEGLASVLNNVNRDDLDIPDTPQQALEVALPLLMHNKDQNVRIGASNVLGACVKLIGIEARERAFRDIIFFSEDSNQNHNHNNNVISEDDTSSVSTIGGISLGSSMMETTTLHGRALALHSILRLQQQQQPQQILLTESQTNALKEWMRNEESPLVREAACLSVGYVLLTPNNLKEYRSPLRKCMKATEDSRVLMAVAKSLTRAAKRENRAHQDDDDNNKKLFLRKNGLPLLDAALMLSMTAALEPSIQNEFVVFLYWAIQKQKNGLQDYMDLAQGENGKIMMSLATKTLSQLASVVEENNCDE